MKNLTEMNRKELLEVAKEMGLKGCSRMKKEELFELIQAEQLVAKTELTLTEEVAEVGQVIEENQEQKAVNLIHISRKQLALMELAKRQSELQATNNGVIVVPVVEIGEEVKEGKEPTIAETVTALYEKHYSNDKKKTGKKGGDLYVAPAQALKPIKEGSKVHRFVQKMMYGASIEDLCEITPNPKSVRVYFSYDLKLKGYGVKQIEDRYYIIFPDGVLEPLIAEKTTK